MIFVTVGSQLPFDRLVRGVDKWSEINKEQDIFAQIGQSDYKPKNFKFCFSMSPDEYNYYINKADLIISHVGMGTIISALECNKPMLLMPRLTCNGEVRNEHQLATVKHFAKLSSINVVNNESELLMVISRLLNQERQSTNKELTGVSYELISVIRKFVMNC